MQRMNGYPKIVPRQIFTEERLDSDCLSYRLACDYIYYRIRKAKFYWPDYPFKNDVGSSADRFKTSLRAVCDSCECQYFETLNDMIACLRITPSTLFGTFWEICDGSFVGGITWGRICALYTFAGSLAVECANLGMSNLVGKIAMWLACYVQEMLACWIETNYGWDGLVEFERKSSRTIQEEKQQSSPKIHTMLGFGLTFGVALTLGAILARV